MKKGFTLIEMLVVMGIIAALVAASIGGYAGITASAERTKCQELVSNVATALSVLYQREGSWPKRIAVNGETGGRLDEIAATGLKGYFAMSTDGSGNLNGLDKFGIVSPWATAVIKRRGSEAAKNTAVSQAKRGEMTIDDHVLRYAVDTDGDGVIKGAMIGGERVDVRAVAIVWCGGKDGYIEGYSKGLKSDDIYSWTVGQTRNVK